MFRGITILEHRTTYKHTFSLNTRKGTRQPRAQRVEVALTNGKLGLHAASSGPKVVKFATLGVARLFDSVRHGPSSRRAPAAVCRGRRASKRKARRGGDPRFRPNRRCRALAAFAPPSSRPRRWSLTAARVRQTARAAGTIGKRARGSGR
jgi:hypothetical protein